MENAECTGQEPVTAFSYKDYNVKVGDLVDFRYEPGYQGQATLSDIIMVSPNTPFDTKEKKDSKYEDAGKIRYDLPAFSERK